MTQLMQTLIGVVQTQQQLLQQQYVQPRQHTPPIPGHGEHPMQRNNIVEFKKLAPPAFKGTIEPLEADNWIMEMEKAFAVQEYYDDEKIRYTAYLLQGEAYNWWCMLNKHMNMMGYYSLGRDFEINFLISIFLEVSEYRKSKSSFI